MSRKVLAKLNFAKFKKRLVKELNLMHDHQYRVHSQFKAFKMARQEANQMQMLQPSSWIVQKMAKCNKVEKKNLLTIMSIPSVCILCIFGQSHVIILVLL